MPVGGGQGVGVGGVGPRPPRYAPGGRRDALDELKGSDVKKRTRSHKPSKIWRGR
jgi:hypothetical protein